MFSEYCLLRRCKFNVTWFLSTETWNVCFSSCCLKFYLLFMILQYLIHNFQLTVFCSWISLIFAQSLKFAVWSSNFGCSFTSGRPSDVRAHLNFHANPALHRKCFLWLMRQLRNALMLEERQNWAVIEIQCCVGYTHCVTAQHLSCKCSFNFLNRCYRFFISSN